MVQVEKTYNGYIIEDKFYLTDDGLDKKYINLMMKKGEDLHFGDKKEFFIDYPGEYDKSGIFFKVYQGEDDKLSYLIKYNDKRYFILQDSSLLENEEIDRVDYWLYRNGNTESVLDKLELEGERISLD